MLPTRYHDALAHQPKYDVIPYEIAKPLSYVLFAVGQLLVLSSTWALGITGTSYICCFRLVMCAYAVYVCSGTYLGDYFGILMDHKVEGFPFNIMRDPMYNGSTLCFVAHALWYV